MIEEGNILKITDGQVLLGETLFNIYWYRVEDHTPPVDLTNILSQFILDVINAVRASQSDEVMHIQPRIDDVTDGVSFAIDPGSYQGTRATTPPLPSFTAWAYRLNRATKVTRPGQKRIAGIMEGDVGNNGVTPNPTVYDPVIAAMEMDIIVDNPVGLDTLITPVIVGRDEFGALDLTRINNVTSVALNPIVSTQVSRKPGR